MGTIWSKIPDFNKRSRWSLTSPSMEQRINGVQRQDLLVTVLREDNTPVPAISIHTSMNVEGQPEHFHHQALQSAESAAGSSAGEGAAVTCSMSFSCGTNLGLTYVFSAGAAQFTAKTSAGAASARVRQNSQSKCKHGGNAFRLEPGNCHQLSNPHVMTEKKI